MILIIHTADLENVFIGVIDKRRFVIKKKFKAKYQQAEKLIVEIDKLLKQGGIGLPDLKGIVVITGPGPFTALRIGVSVANTLAWALKIKIAGLSLAESQTLEELAGSATGMVRRSKAGSLIEPYYGQEPNITLKSRG